MVHNLTLAPQPLAKMASSSMVQLKILITSMNAEDWQLVIFAMVLVLVVILLRRPIPPVEETEDWTDGGGTGSHVEPMSPEPPTTSSFHDPFEASCWENPLEQ